MSKRWRMSEKSAGGAVAMVIVVASIVAASLVPGRYQLWCILGALAICGVVFWASKE